MNLVSSQWAHWVAQDVEREGGQSSHARAPWSRLGWHVRIAEVPESSDKALLANDLSPVVSLEDAGSLH